MKTHLSTVHNKAVEIGDCKVITGDTLLAPPKCKANDLAQISGTDHFNSERFSHLFEKALQETSDLLKNSKL